MSRRFTPTQRAALYLDANGTCSSCGAPLAPSWHGDHQLAFAAGGETDVVNGQALCPACNLVLGARDAAGELATSLRAWQRGAVDAYEHDLPRNFLTVATPGAGKTRLAGTLVGRHLRAGRAELAVIVVPTERLKGQWADAVAGCGVQIAPDWTNGDGALPRGFDGVAVTYAQVAALPDLMRRHVSRHPAVVVFDEVHHCGDTKSWGEAVRHAFAPAAWRIALSGTPFRSDNNAIPFVRYVDGVGQPDVTYDYGEAIADGVCRPVFFPRRGGRMEWATTNGEIVRATFEDTIANELVNQRLRTALALDGEWLPAVLADAHRELSSLRLSIPDAGGLVLATDRDHARGIADLLRGRHGVEPVVVVSDDPDANARIEVFATGDAPWIVAVRMVSEGVDIPRLRVGVYATAVTAELFFRQAIGRLVRVIDADAGENASFYIPDDPRLRQFAATIRTQRDHVLDTETDAILDSGDQPGDGGAEPRGAFVPIASEALDVGGTYDGTEFTAAELAFANDLKARAPQTTTLPTPAVAVLLRLAGHAGPTASPAPSAEEPAHRRRKKLRAANNRIARRLAFLTGADFADVNRSLNEEVGIAGVARATVEELTERLRIGQARLASEAE